MTQQEYINWISEIKEKLPLFLQNMQGVQRKGFYRYSFSGDLYNEKIKWGLGNSVFALKIYYSLGIKPDNLEDILAFIKSFQQRNGEFYDPVVRYTSLPLRLYFAIKEGDKNRLSHKLIKMAETRQSISALRLFDNKPEYEYFDFPSAKDSIRCFIHSLNWQLPWGAGAQVSGLLFLLSVSKFDEKDVLINETIEILAEFQQKDGAWYKGNPSLAQKINGAMKIITGLNAAIMLGGYNHGTLSLKDPQKLIDLSLQATNDAHACDNFNLVYLMRYANSLSDNNYRFEEIDKFIQNRLDFYKAYYHKNFGAFSFNKNKTNTHYYSAFITKGKNEPDIHGTIMFLWGLSVIGNIWGTNCQTGLREFLT